MEPPTETTTTPTAPDARGRTLAIAGFVTTLVGIVSYFTVAVRFPDLRDVPIVNLPMALIGAALSIRGAVRLRGWRSGVAAGASLVATGLFALYLFVISYQMPAATGTPAVGAAAPELGGATTAGKTLSLADLRGQPVVIAFYRGWW